MPQPTTLDECMTALDELLGDEDKAFIDAAEDPRGMIQFHHNLGRHLRNEWGLWGDSPLKQNIRLYHGVTHPDDMSGIILEDYWRWRRRGKTAWERILSDSGAD